MKDGGSLNYILMISVIIVLSFSLFLFSWSFAGFATYTSDSETVFSAGNETNSTNSSSNSSLANSSTTNNTTNEPLQDFEYSPESDDDISPALEGIEYEEQDQMTVFGYPLFPWIYLIIAIVCVILIILIIVSLIFHKKKPKTNTPHSVSTTPIPPHTDPKNNKPVAPPIQKKEVIPPKQNPPTPSKALNPSAQNKNAPVNHPIINKPQQTQNPSQNTTQIQANKAPINTQKTVQQTPTPPNQSNSQTQNPVSNNSQSPNTTITDNLRFVKYYAQNLSHDPRVRIQYLLGAGKKFRDSADTNSAKQVYTFIFEDYKNLHVHDDALYNEIVSFSKSLG